jgi:hypothetical protein
MYAQPNATVLRANDTFAFFEGNYGTAVDVDGDGTLDAYFYNSSLTQVSRSLKYHLSASCLQRIWATSNLALAMIVEPDTLASLYGAQGSPFNHSAPRLTGVDYPKVMVRAAYFNSSANSLHFTVLSASGQVVRLARSSHILR